MTTVVVTNNERQEISEFLDNLKKTVLDQLENGACVELEIQRHTQKSWDDPCDEYGITIPNLIFVGQKWSIDIPNMVAPKAPSTCSEADNLPPTHC